MNNTWRTKHETKLWIIWCWSDTCLRMNRSFCSAHHKWWMYSEVCQQLARGCYIAPGYSFVLIILSQIIVVSMAFSECLEKPKSAINSSFCFFFTWWLNEQNIGRANKRIICFDEFYTSPDASLLVEHCPDILIVFWVRMSLECFGCFIYFHSRCFAEIIILLSSGNERPAAFIFKTGLQTLTCHTPLSCFCFIRQWQLPAKASLYVQYN